MRLVTCLALVLTASLAGADDLYFQVWGVTGLSVMREVPASDDPMGVSEQRYVGAELFGRIPIRTRWAIIFRGETEGASGKFAWKDYRTWRRGVLEGAATFRVFDLDRYSCAVMVGGGASMDLTRDPEHAGQSAPAKYGAGVHCRDEKLKMWANAQALWDKAQGPGIGVEIEVHAPLFTEHAGLGVVVVLAEVFRVDVKVKIRIKEWARKPEEG